MAAPITAIIPNWNGATRLSRLLPALAGQTLCPARVIVVDNGSTDSSCRVAAEFGAECLVLDRNYGFARAVNAGVRASSTHWVAIINNDVDPESDWLERLAAAVESSGACFATGRLLQWANPALLDGCYDLLSRSGLAWRAGHGQPSGRYLEPKRIRCAPFTALILHRDLFEKVGYLDERFGSYLEDVDFCLRCAAAGCWGAYEPSAVARHEGSATLGEWSPRMVELLSRNQVLLIAKHFPEGWANRFGFPILVGHLLWALLAIRHGRFIPWLKGKCAALAAWGEWRRNAAATPADKLEIMLREDERLIRDLQSSGPADRFWALYFRCLGGA
jgi:hypothetical protein